MPATDTGSGRFCQCYELLATKKEKGKKKKNPYFPYIFFLFLSWFPFSLAVVAASWTPAALFFLTAVLFCIHSFFLTVDASKKSRRTHRQILLPVSVSAGVCV